MTDLDAGLAPEQVAVLAARLSARGWRLATAESCTGGLIAAACTDRAGSSDWFERGYVTYSNAAKTELLGVPAALIEAHGAVSVEVAQAMAEGAAAHAPVEVALSVTGIAGPGGGTPSKPVGTVCFGWLVPEGSADGLLVRRVDTDRRRFFGDRAAVRAAAMRYALDGLIKRLAAA